MLEAELAPPHVQSDGLYTAVPVPLNHAKNRRQESVWVSGQRRDGVTHGYALPDTPSRYLALAGRSVSNYSRGGAGEHRQRHSSEAGRGSRAGSVGVRLPHHQPPRRHPS